MRRFGPSPVLYVAVLVAVGLVVAYLVTGAERLTLLVAGILILVGSAPGWRWYEIDADGIHQRGPTGSKFVPWEDVESVVGRRAGRAGRPTTVLTQFVVDAAGRPVLRLDPWIFHRRRMVRLILATVAARRHGEPPRDD